jgi:hypothetical protein
MVSNFTSQYPRKEAPEQNRIGKNSDIFIMAFIKPPEVSIKKEVMVYDNNISVFWIKAQILHFLGDPLFLI